MPIWPNRAHVGKGEVCPIGPGRIFLRLREGGGLGRFPTRKSPGRKYKLHIIVEVSTIYNKNNHNHNDNHDDDDDDDDDDEDDHNDRWE